MQRKDIAKAEDDRPNSTQKEKDNDSKECLNCQHSKKRGLNKNHAIWYCTNIEYCYACKQKHLAMGPDCPNKNKKLFDYDKFLDIKIKKQDSTNVSNKPPGTKHHANATTTSPPPTLVQNNLPGYAQFDVNMGRDILWQ